ncbi:MAG: hypothetical protein F9K43_15485 [Bauldia sp.]|nr:MAG: hypothetical protein F9K43_15485 [Bauldia sp.]MBZ0230226.1 hypothetical protein [Bauldia sp.]
MNRIIGVVLVLLMIAGAAVTYDMKYRASVAAQRVARLHAAIGKEKEAIALLKAEWSVVSQPGRLQAIATRYQDHFRLEPFSPSQVATLDEIPLKPVEAKPAATGKTVADATPAGQ